MEIGNLLKESVIAWIKILWKLIPLGIVAVLTEMVIGVLGPTIIPLSSDSAKIVTFLSVSLVSLIVFYITIVFSMKSVGLCEENDDGSLYYFKKFFSFILLTSFVIGMVLLGSLAMIIPGIIVACTFGFSVFAQIDENMSILEALTFSQKITKNKRVEIFIQLLLLYLVQQAVLAIVYLIFIIVFLKSLYSSSLSHSESQSYLLLFLGITSVYPLSAFPCVSVSVIYKKLKESYEESIIIKE